MKQLLDLLYNNKYTSGEHGAEFKNKAAGRSKRCAELLVNENISTSVGNVILTLVFSSTSKYKGTDSEDRIKYNIRYLKIRKLYNLNEDDAENLEEEIKDLLESL